MGKVRQIARCIKKGLAYPFVNRATRSYWSLPEVLMSLVLGIGIAVYIAHLNIIETELTLANSLQGSSINDFFLYTLKVPIGVLAALTALLALFAANHRSQQSAYSMKLLKTQNDFSNYYSHRKEFRDHLEKFSDDSKAFLTSTNALHDALYPDGRIGNLTLNIGLLNEFVYIGNQFYKSLVVGVCSYSKHVEFPEEQLNQSCFRCLEFGGRLGLAFPHNWEGVIKFPNREESEKEYLEQKFNEIPNFGVKLKYIYFINELLLEIVDFEPNEYLGVFELLKAELNGVLYEVEYSYLSN